MVNLVAAVGSVVAAVTSIIILFWHMRKTKVILTFNNDKDTIEYKAGESSRMWFFLKNTGNKVTVTNVQAMISFPDNLKPTTLGDPERRKEVEYFWERKPGRVVFYVDALPPKSHPARRRINPVKFSPDPQRYEFRYEILGDRVKKTNGKLIVDAKS